MLQKKPERDCRGSVGGKQKEQVVDMSLIRNIHQDGDKRKNLENIISYTRERDMKVIAEGVETEEELRTLIDLGVDYLQGYFFARPSALPPLVNPRLQGLILDLQQPGNEA